MIPELSHDQALSIQRSAQILLHLRWDDPDQPGITTGKLAEYLAARRPILSTGRYNDVVTDILTTTPSRNPHEVGR